jgi:hypothetical protein
MKKLLFLVLFLLTSCEFGSYGLEWQNKKEAKQIAGMGTLDVVGQVVPENNNCVLILGDPNSPRRWTVFFSSEGRKTCASVHIKDKVKLRFVDTPAYSRGHRTETGDWLALDILAISSLNS